MKKICIYLIEWYQRNISNVLDRKNIKCKYYPTCSEYTKQAIEKYGVKYEKNRNAKKKL